MQKKRRRNWKAVKMMKDEYKKDESAKIGDESMNDELSECPKPTLSRRGKVFAKNSASSC